MARVKEERIKDEAGVGGNKLGKKGERKWRKWKRSSVREGRMKGGGSGSWGRGNKADNRIVLMN